MAGAEAFQVHAGRLVLGEHANVIFLILHPVLLAFSFFVPVAHGLVLIDKTLHSVDNLLLVESCEHVKWEKACDSTNVISNIVSEVIVLQD